MELICEDPELLEAFLTESSELLEKLDDDLVSLEKSPADKDLLNRIFRSIHTIKGTAGFLDFNLLVKVTHNTEDLLNRLRKEELKISAGIMDVILEAVDLVKLLVNDIKNGDIQERQIEGILGKLAPFLSGVAQPPPSSDKAEKICSAPLSAKVNVPSDLIQKVENPAEKKVSEPTENSTVRIDVKRLDDLMNQVGELILERNRMMQLNNDYQNGVNLPVFAQELTRLAKRVNLVTSELQMQAMKMRMIPVEKIFKKFPRIVRDLARNLGKEVELQLHGEETELDRSIVDELSDPLVHLIRNALDHGVESPDDRVARGKSRSATVILSASHEGNKIVISIKDDGRGIDTTAVGRKAVDKSVVTAEQLASMGKREIIDLIFLPGFSTVEKASDISGRGVGMDVVRTNIKKLNGIIEVKSEPGQGAEFILRLPLTLAIIQSLLVEVEGETYCVPLSMVLETIRIDKSTFHHVGKQEVLRRNEEVLPLIRLNRLFGIEEDANASPFCYIVIVGIAERRLGLIVTKLLGQQEVAIKSLGKYLSDIPGIAGSTLLGDGRVTLIVDPAGLIEGESGISNLNCGKGVQ